MRSVPSTTERLSGEASTSIGKHVAGRRLAKRSSSLRMREEPALGPLLLRQRCPTWARPPPRRGWRGPAGTARSVASAAAARRSASMAAPPTSPASNSKRDAGGLADHLEHALRLRASPPARCRRRAAPRSCRSPWSIAPGPAGGPSASAACASGRAHRAALSAAVPVRPRRRAPTAGASGRSGRRPRRARNRNHCGMRGHDQHRRAPPASSTPAGRRRAKSISLKL